MWLTRWLALVLVLVLIAPPALSAGSPQTPSTDTPAGPRAYEPWWGYEWKYRRPITIDNTANPYLLEGYQMLINISSNGNMKSDFSDLRFTQYNSSLGQNQELYFWMENKTNGVKATVWVNVSSIKESGTTTIYMYYGNPGAATASNRTATLDVYSTFDADLDGWTYTAVNYSGGGYTLSLDTGQGTPAPSAYISGDFVVSTVIVRDYMERVLTKGTGTGLDITVDYRASSTASSPVSTNACLDLADMAGNIVYDQLYIRGGVTDTGWTRDQQRPILTEIQSISQVRVRLGVGDSWANNYSQKNWYDNIRIRKYTSPEPTYSIGQEELPFAFKSLRSSPNFPSDGDTVSMNAMFNNPTTETIKLQLAAREADDFNSTADYFYQGEVSLAPSTDTSIPFSWTAKGGTRKIWVAVYDYPVGSIKIKVNRDPTLAPIKDQSLLQGVEFRLQLNASDMDGDTLEWSIDNALFALTALSNRTAEMSFLPSNDDVGVHGVTITVRDPMNRSASIRVNFTVKNVNDPPVLTKIPSLAATQYKELRYQANATDPDIKWGDVLTFSDNTDLFDIDGMSGVFFFTPAEEQVGKHNVKVTVTDIEGASETSTFTITVGNVNDPPTLEFLPPQFATQGRLFQLKIAAADPDLKSDPTEKLRFSDDCPLFNINNDSGMISFTPSNDDLGVWMSNITVTDRGGLSNSTPLTITVMNANDPPTLDAIPAQTATEEQPFQYRCIATDPDVKWGLDNLTFTDDTDMFNIDSKTGAIAFTPTGALVGSRRITITVKDERGASASAAFDLSVVHVNHRPFDVAIRFPLDGARLKEGDQMWLDGTAKDNDKGDTLQYSWLDNGNPAGLGKNISVNLKPGKHTITLEVSDGTETASSEVSVDVAKKEQVTTGGNSWLPIGGTAAALVAVLAVVGFLATRRRMRRTGAPEPAEDVNVASIPEKETVALPTVPPAKTAPQEPGDEAKRMIDSAVERLANYQEAHPDEALDVEPVMEKLDIVREFLKSKNDDDALDFARKADAEVNRLTHAKEPAHVSVKKKKKTS